MWICNRQLRRLWTNVSLNIGWFSVSTSPRTTHTYLLIITQHSFVHIIQTCCATVVLLPTPRPPTRPPALWPPSWHCPPFYLIAFDKRTETLQTRQHAEGHKSFTLLSWWCDVRPFHTAVTGRKLRKINLSPSKNYVSLLQRSLSE